MRTWNNLMAVRSTIKKSSTQIRACRKYSSSPRRIKKRKKVVFNNQLKFISSLNLFYGMEWSKWCPTYLVSGYLFDLFLQRLTLTANKNNFRTNCEKLWNFFSNCMKLGPEEHAILKVASKNCWVPLGSYKECRKVHINCWTIAGLG